MAAGDGQVRAEHGHGGDPKWQRGGQCRILSGSRISSVERRPGRMTDQLQTLLQILLDLARLAGGLVYLALGSAMLIAWVAWWLFAVNWKKAWPVLAEGAWAPLVLLILVGALVWSRL